MGPARNAESLEPMTSSYLVELSLLAPSGQDAVADEIKVFAEQLRPLVHLEKIDYRRPQPYSWSVYSDTVFVLILYPLFLANTLTAVEFHYSLVLTSVGN